jgi:hypothetical protein
MKYWQDPEKALKEFDPEINDFDRTIYNFIVPAGSRLALSSNRVSETIQDSVDKGSGSSDESKQSFVKD